MPNASKMPSARFERLDPWRESIAGARVSRVCRRFPPEARFELAAQLRELRARPRKHCRRSGSQTKATFLRHLGIALGSMAEVENHLICPERGIHHNRRMRGVADPRLASERPNCELAGA